MWPEEKEKFSHLCWTVKQGIPKGCLKKRTISEEEGGLRKWNSEGMGGGGGGRAFWNFLRQGGGKISMPPVVWYGYFLESPNDIFQFVTQAYSEKENLSSPNRS